MASTKELQIVNQGPSSYQFSSNLDGVNIYLLFNYNRRNDTWYLDLLDSQLDNLLTGIPCLSNVDQLASRFSLDNVFILGDIIIADSSTDKDDPSYENFGDYVSAFYTSIAQ